MSTHSAIATTSKGEFDAIDVPTKSPGEGEVLLKVEYSAMIPFDTYQTDMGYAVEQYPTVLGFNASGVVVDVGSGVKDLVEGDRVTAFSFSPKGMQEYSVQPRTVCAKIPDSLPLAEAATIPDNFVTAFYTLFNQLSLPIPDSFPATTPPPLASTPILIYGAGSTVGQYAIQLLRHAGYRHIVVTASSRHHSYLRSLGATNPFDYKSPYLISNIARVFSGESNVTLAVDCIGTESTLAIIAKVISPEGKLAVLLPVKEGSSLTVGSEGKMFMEIPANMNPLPESTKVVGVRTFLYQKDQYLAENLMPKILPSLLESGLIRPNRVRLLDEGSFKERVSIGLDLLRNNKISGQKVVVKVTT